MKNILKYGPVYVTMETISISNACMQSFPCQHNCTIMIGDKVERCTLNGKVIASKWWESLDEEQKIHFMGYKSSEVKKAKCGCTETLYVNGSINTLFCQDHSLILSKYRKEIELLKNKINIVKEDIERSFL